MRLLKDFKSLTLASTGAAVGFPATNAATLDPMQRWVSDAYAGEVMLWSENQVGISGGIFLNRCNFPSARFQMSEFAGFSPTPHLLDIEISLVLDDAGNRKGWFDIGAFKTGYIRVAIPASQSLDNSETTPAVGNLIVGVPEALPLVSDFNPRLIKRMNRFESDSGSLVKTPAGRARHIIQMGIGDSLANIRAMPKKWTIGVLYADLANAGEAWLVYPPEDWDRPIKNVLDAQLRFTLEERP